MFVLARGASSVSVVVIVTVVASPFRARGHSPSLGQRGVDVTVEQVVGVGCARARCCLPQSVVVAVVVVVVFLAAGAQRAVDATG